MGPFASAVGANVMATAHRIRLGDERMTAGGLSRFLSDLGRNRLVSSEQFVKRKPGIFWTEIPLGDAKLDGLDPVLHPDP